MTRAAPSSPRPVLVASHERSGTHLLIDTLRRNFAACRARPSPGHNPHDWLYFSVDRLNPEHPRRVTTAFADRALARAARPLLKTHTLPGFARIAPEARGWLDATLGGSTTLYVLRDGRAVMPSFHGHRMAVEPRTPKVFAEFLRAPIDGRTPPRIWAEHARAWTAQPGVHVVRFERLTGQPAEALGELASVLGETPDPRVRGVLPPRGATPWAARLTRFTGRLASSNLVERGGRTPRWRELFTDADRAYFLEQTGGALAELGYDPADGRAA